MFCLTGGVVAPDFFMALSDSRPHVHTPAPMDLPLKLGLARFTHGISPAAVTMAYADWFAHLMVSPSRQADLLASAMRKALLWTQYAPQAWQGDCARCVEPAPQDKRFSPHDWHALPFSAMAQAFLLQDQWWTEAMTGVRGVSRHHEEVAAFTTRQWLDMWSPSNFLMTNPQVLKETLATGGTNLANGMANWSHDALAVLTEGKPRGVDAFLPGEGVALTPGKVVFRNRLIELIRYEPATTRVDAEPVLIVPSWIMKYYILDLTPADSLVRYLVGQGHSVFMVSWKNPDSQDRDLGLDDYIELGVMAALKVVGKLRPGVGIHAAGYCLGGTLLAMAAAALGARPHNPLKTVSLLAAQTDFHEPGELGLFIDESQISFLEDLMAERGYLDGRQMAGAFALINSKDLVWSKLVHEYLMGATDTDDGLARLECRCHAHASAHAQRVPAPAVPAQRPGRRALPGEWTRRYPGRHQGAAVCGGHRARPCLTLDVGLQDPSPDACAGELCTDIGWSQCRHRQSAVWRRSPSPGQLPLRDPRGWPGAS